MINRFFSDLILEHEKQHICLEEKCAAQCRWKFQALRKIKVKFHSLGLIMSCRLCCRPNQMVGLILWTYTRINES